MKRIAAARGERETDAGIRKGMAVRACQEAADLVEIVDIDLDFEVGAFGSGFDVDQLRLASIDGVS